MSFCQHITLCGNIIYVTSISVINLFKIVPLIVVLFKPSPGLSTKLQYSVLGLHVLGRCVVGYLIIHVYLDGE